MATDPVIWPAKQRDYYDVNSDFPFQLTFLSRHTGKRNLLLRLPERARELINYVCSFANTQPQNSTTLSMVLCACMYKCRSRWPVSDKLHQLRSLCGSIAVDVKLAYNTTFACRKHLHQQRDLLDTTISSSPLKAFSRGKFDPLTSMRVWNYGTDSYTSSACLFSNHLPFIMEVWYPFSPSLLDTYIGLLQARAYLQRVR